MTKQQVYEQICHRYGHIDLTQFERQSLLDEKRRTTWFTARGLCFAVSAQGYTVEPVPELIDFQTSKKTKL